jgi:hypothetical protein
MMSAAIATEIPTVFVLSMSVRPPQARLRLAL